MGGFHRRRGRPLSCVVGVSDADNDDDAPRLPGMDFVATAYCEVVERPSSINVLTASELTDQDDRSFPLLVAGFNRPRPGQVWLITPAVGAGPLRTVDHFHVQVGEADESDEVGFEWLVDVEPHAVPTPRSWYELTTEVDRQGLVHLGNAENEGTKIIDPATIDVVWDMLGL